MADKFFDAMFTASVVGGSSGPAPVIVSKNITANGTYSALDDQADGYNPVVVNVPNTYTAADEGKVVSSGALVAQTSTTATVNGTLDTTTNNEVVVNVPNTYTAGDEGKVVSGGSLVAQTSTTATTNGTINTTTNNEVVVNVPNTYTAADEGKVVSSGALIAQTAYPSTITENGTYNTTENNSVTINVPSSSGAAYYTDFPITSSTNGHMGVGIVGRKGETGTVFVGSRGAYTDFGEKCIIHLNNFTLSDYLTQNIKLTVSGPSSNYYYATLNITDNTIVMERGNFLSDTNNYYFGYKTATL